MRTSTRARMRITIEETFHYWTKYIHVGVEFLSTHANIYESTHVHYDGKVFTCILLINETQVAFMGE